MRAPMAATAASFSGTAFSGMTTTKRASAARAAQAAPRAALPALTVIRPGASSSGVNERTRFQAPRTLNEPVT